MHYIPIIKPYFTGEEAELITQCLQSGWVALGPKVAEFEKKVCEYENAKNGIATTSCTTALHLLMVALGVNENYDVLVPSFTFIATANSVEYTGATAVLVDIKTDTYCLDTDFLENYIKLNYTLKNKKMINNKTGKILFGIIAVNEFGLCADIPKINEIAKYYGLKVIEDSACALGASINGIHEGGFGNPSCISFHTRKSITTGEGGMILTDDDELARKIRSLRSHGATVSEYTRHKNKGYLLPSYEDLGFNYRMNDIQGSMGIAQINKFEYILEQRIKKAKRYNSLISENLNFINIPLIPIGHFHTFQSYVTIINYKALGFDTIEEGNDFRNKLMDILEGRGIATRQGSHAVHTLDYYKRKYGYKPYDLKGSYECDKLTLTLPLYVTLSEDEQDYVIDEIKKAYYKIIGK